jgi:hypothetical protein
MSSLAMIMLSVCEEVRLHVAVRLLRESLAKAEKRQKDTTVSSPRTRMLSVLSVASLVFVAINYSGR